MNIRRIVQHTDLMNQLHEYAEPVTEFDDALAQLATDMAYTMKEHGGVGLAAPQVGVMKRLFVIATEEGWQTYVNPQPLTYDKIIPMNEGCLSCVGLEHGIVMRPDKIEAVWQGIEGKRRTGRLIGLRARVFLHELDHLNGTLYSARAVPAEVANARPSPNRKERRTARHRRTA